MCATQTVQIYWRTSAVSPIVLAPTRRTGSELMGLVGLCGFTDSKKGTKVEMELSHHPPPHALEAISTKVHQGGPVEFRFDGGSVSAAVKAAVTVPSFSLPRLAQRDWGSSSGTSQPHREAYRQRAKPSHILI